MIDRVRNTVLTLLNKENRGIVTPAEFNRLCGLAQRTIFEDNFYHYNRYINMQNQRQTNSEYSDIPKNIREKIDVFAETSTLTLTSSDPNIFEIDENDVYRVMQLYYGDAIIEETPKSIIKMLKAENYSTPDENFPVYTRFGDKFEVLPNTVTSGVTAFYIREPKTPKWTFLEVAGNPVYNPSASDFQDLEIHPSDETELIIKVLAYSGLNIRDPQVIQDATNKQVSKDNKKQ